MTRTGTLSRTSTLSGAALLLSASLLLAGCGGQGDSADPAPSGDAAAPSASAESSSPAASAPAAEPAAGETITGTGYAYVVPEGWAVPDAANVPPQADTFAADLTDLEDGFADNVNVVLSPASGEITPDQVETLGVEELEGTEGASDITVKDRVSVAGDESAHISATFEQQGTTYNVDQFYAVNDDQTYIITFSFSPEVSDADRAAVYESVLVTWSWA
ncbi:LpqN/LpqT family lipoprotein [Microbacterium radiodurans]|uniref:DUF1795 domain-containing protein n=1 Tax=Microbacterium radiodurans TaxID=661398 RepID=A0A5J5ISP1_9MICO|nr:LpqN/LpqT family lipoprotein [Microbacterium radiodurans]KAA9089007.1 hypothetical protein F6B42_00400 [Microbacterium radiodurans]